MSDYNKSVKGKLFKYFKERLHTKPSTKGWERCDCFFCGGKYTYGINVSISKTKCFKCDEHKTPVELLMYMEGFTTYSEASQFLKVQQEYTGYSDNQRIKKSEVKRVELPDDFTPINIKTSLLGKAAQRYVKKRGFDIDQLATRGVGYCTTGPYGGYIVFPFYVSGKLIFFQGRKFTAFGTKMKNPSEEDFGIGKSKIIYNEDALYIYDEVDLVESITNCLTLDDNSVAILGKSISQYQLSKLIASPCEIVNILLDPDAILKAIDLGLKIVNYKKGIRLVELPEGQDVNELGKEGTNELKENSPILRYNDLLKLKNKHRRDEGTVDPYINRPSAYSPSRGAR